MWKLSVALTFMASAANAFAPLPTQTAFMTSTSLYAVAPETVAPKIKDIIVDQLGKDPEEIKDDSGFSDLGVDSLDMVELVMALEEEFDIELPEEKSGELTDVKSLINFVAESVEG